MKNIKSGTGHKWTKHGKLPYVTYDESATPVVSTTSSTEVESVSGLPMLREGSEGKSVQSLQILLIGYGYSCGDCGADGEFGKATGNALEEFQKQNFLEADRVCGPKTWAKILGV